MNFRKVGFVASAMALALVGSASAEAAVPAGVQSLISDTSAVIVLIVAAVITAGLAVLGAMVGLKAVKWAYRKITSFFA